MKPGARPQMLHLKDRPRRTPAQRWLDWSQHFLFVVAILTLGYVGFTLLDAKLYQAGQDRQFQQAKNSAPAIPDSDLHSESPAAVEPLPASPANTATALRGPYAVGRIEIQRIGLAAMIMEGTDERTLRRAVGHFPGTALPGQRGNVAIAGHRDTFFRALRNIRKNDEITLETATGSYSYQADYSEVVEPQNTEVLDSSDESRLTLVTCYPFSYVGPAPKRFVVHAHRVR